jgi:hypothetical protein
MRNIGTLKVYTAFALFAIASCKEPVPEFVHELIESYPAGQAHEIWQYRFNGETVYYIPPQPYDIPSTLYNSDGEIICSPDGGLTGYGDGKCPTFFKKRRGGTLIWKVGQEVPSP